MADSMSARDTLVGTLVGIAEDLEAGVRVLLAMLSNRYTVGYVGIIVKWLDNEAVRIMTWWAARNRNLVWSSRVLPWRQPPLRSIYYVRPPHSTNLPSTIA